MAVQLAVRFQWPGNRDLLEASTLWELHEARLKRKFPAPIVLTVEDDFHCEQKEQILIAEEQLPNFEAREKRDEQRFVHKTAAHFIDRMREKTERISPRKPLKFVSVLANLTGGRRRIGCQPHKGRMARPIRL